MSSTTLTLTPISGEPRVLDLTLAERLGFERPVKIRDIIKRNETKLLKFGILPTVGKIHEGAGRPTAEFYLNQKQAIFICMKSETERAFDVQIEIVHVFDAYLNDAEPVPLPATAEERITSAQQAEIRQMAHRIGCAFTMKTSGDQAAFALVRESFGVPSAYQLPARQFADAMALLEDAKRLADAYLLRKVKLEQKFLRSHFRASLPELNQQIAELESWVNRPSPLALRLS